MRQLIILLLIGISVQISAQNLSERSRNYNTDNGLAINGYDPVAYFTTGKPSKGSAQIKATYLGLTYNFISEVNRTKFLKSPMQFEPQFGGWCAFAMGEYGDKVEINPETYKIVEGKLYLFYNAYFNNTLKSWNKDQKNLISKAEKNWSNILNGKSK